MEDSQTPTLDSRELAEEIAVTPERLEALIDSGMKMDATIYGWRRGLPESMRKDAADFAFRFEHAFRQYIRIGLYDLRVRDSLCTWLEEAHDDERKMLYPTFGKRWEFAFKTTDVTPELDERVEVVASALPHDLGGPDILWKSFAVLKAYATSIDAALNSYDIALTATTAEPLRLIQQAEQELRRMQEKLSQLEADYPILKVAEIIREPEMDVDPETLARTMDSREREETKKWTGNVINFMRARIRFKGNENTPDAFPLGLPSRGESWNYGEEEVGIVAVANEYLP